LDRETAVVAEAIEQPPARVAGRRRAVLALIEKPPRLLSVAKIDLVLARVVAHHDGIRYFSAQHFDLLIESLEPTRADIVASQDARRAESLLEDRDDVREESLHPLGQRLYDEHVGVLIDDQRREPIALRVHDAVGGRVDREPLAKRDRGVQPRGEE